MVKPAPCTVVTELEFPVEFSMESFSRSREKVPQADKGRRSDAGENNLQGKRSMVPSVCDWGCGAFQTLSQLSLIRPAATFSRKREKGFKIGNSNRVTTPCRRRAGDHATPPAAATTGCRDTAPFRCDRQSRPAC